MDVVEIELPGEPVAKARARVTKRGAFTPRKTQQYERALRLAAKTAMKGRPPFDGPIELLVMARFRMPIRWPKWKRTWSTAHCSKPDWDNVGKITDALSGIVWQDDSQVIDGRVVKRYDDGVGSLYVLVKHYPVQITSRAKKRPS